MKKIVHYLRVVALVEGISYLILLGLAMPLKYLWGKPLAVKITGMAHGVLFILFCILLAMVWRKAGWPIGRAILMFIASILPFGAFVFDRRMPQYEAEFQSKLSHPDSLN